MGRREKNFVRFACFSRKKVEKNNHPMMIRKTEITI